MSAWLKETKLSSDTWFMILTVNHTHTDEVVPVNILDVSDTTLFLGDHS